MLEILQSGLDVYWHRRYQPVVSALQVCQNRLKPNIKGHSLKLENLAGAFLILTVGLALSILAFLLEIAHHICFERP